MLRIYAANLHFDFEVSKVYFKVKHLVGVESRRRMFTGGYVGLTLHLQGVALVFLKNLKHGSWYLTEVWQNVITKISFPLAS